MKNQNMTIEQIFGIPTLIVAAIFFKWGFQDINKKNKDWYAIARNFGTGFTTLLLAIFLLMDTVEI